jgi:hypothetical protein
MAVGATAPEWESEVSILSLLARTLTRREQFVKSFFNFGQNFFKFFWRHRACGKPM